MENDKKAAARAALTKYIEENNCRKTTERFALLDTILKVFSLWKSLRSVWRCRTSM